MWILYIVPIILNLVMIFAGYATSKGPMAYDQRMHVRYPMYASRRAAKNRENWDFSQVTYGKLLLKFVIPNIVLSALSVPLIYIILEYLWIWEDAAILMLLTVAPTFIFLIVACVLTEKKLKEFEGKKVMKI